MDTAQRQYLQALIADLWSFKESVQQREGYLLESIRNDDEGGIHLSGNTAGLISFVCQILELTLKDFEGAHIHFDENSGFPEGSAPVTIFREDV